MLRLTFVIAAVLATVGTALAVAGIQQPDSKQFATGFILLLGAGVFAILSLGARRTAVPPEHCEPRPPQTPS